MEDNLERDFVAPRLTRQSRHKNYLNLSVSHSPSLTGSADFHMMDGHSVALEVLGSDEGLQADGALEARLLRAALVLHVALEVPPVTVDLAAVPASVGDVGSLALRLPDDTHDGLRVIALLRVQRVAVAVVSEVELESWLRALDANDRGPPIHVWPHRQLHGGCLHAGLDG